MFDEPIEKATEGSFKNKLEVQDCLGINDHVVYQNHLDLSDLLVNLSTGEAVVDISVLEGSLDWISGEGSVRLEQLNQQTEDDFKEEIIVDSSLISEEP